MIASAHANPIWLSTLNGNSCAEMNEYTGLVHKKNSHSGKRSSSFHATHAPRPGTPTVKSRMIANASAFDRRNNLLHADAKIPTHIEKNIVFNSTAATRATRNPVMPPIINVTA